MRIKNLELRWTGNSGFRIADQRVLYLDPFKLRSPDSADIILITHGHFDHCSIEDIKKIVKDGTEIVATTDCSSRLAGLWNVKMHLVVPGRKLRVLGIEIEAVPAYNLESGFHERLNDWVGYLITLDGQRIYHAGDTDFIPEMETLKNIDVALLPVGGTYTMDAESAAEAANTIMPSVAIPMHYGDTVGSPHDAERFKKLCRCRVEIMQVD